MNRHLSFKEMLAENINIANSSIKVAPSSENVAGCSGLDIEKLSLLNTTFCKDISKYTKMAKIGHGTIGPNKENLGIDVSKLTSLISATSSEDGNKYRKRGKIEDEAESNWENSGLDIEKLSSLTTTFVCEDVGKYTKLTKIEDETESDKEKSTDNESELSPPFTSFSRHKDVTNYKKMAKFGHGTSGSFKETLSERIKRANSSTKMFPCCEDVRKYTKMVKIGKGTYGEVFKARNPKTNRVVALKEILNCNEKEGFPVNSIKEIKLHLQLKHKNIVRLIEICRSEGTAENSYKSTFHLVLEFCEHDLAGLLGNKDFQYGISEMKIIMRQLFNGLFYLHGCKIMHRDLKSSNILMKKNGILKLADFGLSCVVKTEHSKMKNCYTNKVVTLWYRPPELLLGETNYNTSVDMWSAGCIMAELWTRRAILQGNSELAQLKLICQLCGPIPSSYTGIENLHMKNFNWSRKEQIKESKRKELELIIRDKAAIRLLFKLLDLNPVNRISADAALNADYFFNDPMYHTGNLERALGKLNRSCYEFLLKTDEWRQSQMNRPPNGKLLQVSNDQYQDRVF